jgi:hypothetical protein
LLLPLFGEKTEISTFSRRRSHIRTTELHHELLSLCVFITSVRTGVSSLLQHKKITNQFRKLAFGNLARRKKKKMLSLQMERKLPFLQSILAIWCKKMFLSKKMTQTMQYSHRLINVETIMPIIFMFVHFTCQEFEMRRFLSILNCYTNIQFLTLESYIIHCKTTFPNSEQSYKGKMTSSYSFCI